MLGLTAIPAAIELILLPFCPESPRYMLIQRKDEKTARKGGNMSEPTVIYKKWTGAHFTLTSPSNRHSVISSLM